MQKTKQQRYEELAAMALEDQTRKESLEQTQLFYELNPEDWDSLKSSHSQQRTPRDQWGIDTSMYL